ncbi:MAG TPA: hypothetical protein VFX98_09945 [Longimicrobiaceae bacterium]|nr:hypothetical protein [Longimicrobiaceae bacterium]
MPERPRDAGIERIRAHARAQVARSSLRKVAKVAGVKVGATKKFIDGSVPYERNARLWKKWYARELKEGRAEGGDDSLAPEDAEAALEPLFWGVPVEQRGQARARAVEFFRELYAGLGLPPPTWVGALAEPGTESPA